jgi:hypothetical protein
MSDSNKGLVTKAFAEISTINRRVVAASSQSVEARLRFGASVETKELNLAQRLPRKGWKT